MTSRRTKLARAALALISAAGTCAVLLLLLDRSVPVIEFADPARTTADGSPDAPPHRGKREAVTDDAPSVLEVARPDYPPSAFVREPWRMQLFSGQRHGSLPDPFVHFRYRPNLATRHPWPEHPAGEWWTRTNSLGLREDDELLEGWPDLRILVTGDSHTDGVCNNDESFTNLLEARLRMEHPDLAIEALNAGRGGYDFYNYLGTVERFVDLRPDVVVVAVYGGNDFEGVLTLYHQYNGSKRPPGAEQYRELIDAALAVEAYQPALAQCFVSLKYFDVHPRQMEVALQAARDVSTEILVACLRHSAHPIFVYIPPVADVEWERHAQDFEGLARLLEISPEGLESTNRMADSYLDYLRSLRVDVLDMRDVFRAAGPGNYWVADHHINLRGQRLVAEALHPMVLAGRPLDLTHTRRAPGSTGPLEAVHLLSAASGLEALAPLEGLASAARADFDLELFERLYEGRPGVLFEPLAGLIWAPNLAAPSEDLGFATPFTFRTNRLGLRSERELAREVDARVVLVGDEQVTGACANADSIAGRVLAGLSARRPDGELEVVNAAVAGHGFQNYYGVLERVRPLAPQVLVMAVSSGSDFFDAVRVEAASNRRDFPRDLDDYRELLEAARADFPGLMSQSFESILHFDRHRAQGKRAVELALSIATGMQQLCIEAGIELVIAHVPEPGAAGGLRGDPAFDQLRERLEIPDTYLDINRRLAEAFIEQVEAAGMRVIRLEDDLAEASQGGAELFLEGDYLLGDEANAIVARRLTEVITALLED